ncbi:Hsp20/alpha crystallin family protein [Thiolapillus brandeum]|uniref:Heat shock protein HSP20 n=1 Tax=Thiolapillus brandeum TaxID=1076588 RepID=A0A7U6JHV7_9GAMM|nr:Hsp20/alpha crystallin family protein [Thiolapillus brandeum]BAO44197.1 heat shock protein HSP20 [Thiolapillus brandeum]
MNDKTELATKQENEIKPVGTHPEASIRPAVDIFEDESGITLHADMPGISRDRLNVKVEGDTLTIEGDAEIPMPEGMEPLYADVQATHYQRSFTLSSEMDPDKVDASLTHGVLTLRIPKREEHKPRRIEVQVG